MGKVTATCYILNEDTVLLQKKAEGLFGGGKWNAPGGKVKEGELPEEGAIREVYEETEIRVEDLKLSGKIYFYVEGDLDQTLHIYKTKKFSGEGKNGREGILKWFNINDIPFDDMWGDVKSWLPLLLENKKFSGKFYYSINYQNFLNGSVNADDANW